MKKHQPSGFTLIELLVVISIIALLISILLPALSKARAMADVSYSLSNIKGLTFSLQSYAADSKSFLPYLRFPNDANQYPSNSQRTWASALYNTGYVENIPSFWGRTEDLVRASINTTAMRTQPLQVGWLSIGYGGVGDRSLGAPMMISRLDGARPMPSRTLCLVEDFDTGSGDGLWAGSFQCSPGHLGRTNWTSRLYNIQGKNVHSYHDGHATATDGSDVGWNIGRATTTDYAINKQFEIGEFAGEWTYPDRYAVSQYAPWYYSYLVDGIVD